MIQTCLCLTIDSNRQNVLMIHKKRGQGEGKLNFPGGKIQADESVENGVCREVLEETGIEIKNLNLVGKLEFLFQDPGKDWNNDCFVYEADHAFGSLLESQEARPFWQNLDSLPIERMWKADGIWIQDWKQKKKFSLQITYSSTHEIVNIKRQEINF